jgi:hypothetical protein
MRILYSLALLLLVTAALGSAPAAHATLYGPYCPSGYFYSNTATYWGTGATCGDADSDLRSQAQAEAAADCPDYGYCQASLVVTGACHQTSSNPDEYMEDGHLQFKCVVCPTCP